MKTAQELIDIIKENNLQKDLFHTDTMDESEFEDEEGNYIDGVTHKENLKSIGIENFEYVAGREDTSEFWAVIHFKNENVYLKFTGWYDSYGQYDHDYHDEVTEVFPKEVTQTIYT